MTKLFDKRLAGIERAGGHRILAHGSRGIEKESLRITPAGRIAKSPHPHELGSALTNRYITTDYSEALVEFVTPPEPAPWAAQQFLCDIHQFAHTALNDELLWPLSMPCRLGSEQDIPVAHYGSSNIAQMKTIYRRGLGHRYGRYMQVISGIHFNYSVPDDFWPAWQQLEQSPAELAELKSHAYMGAVRNVRRLDWLLLYLFGASPALCPSFLAGVESDLDVLADGTLYGRWATSLRMSDLGYQNTNQSTLQVSANSVEEYVRDLSAAIMTPNAEYEAIGLRDGHGYRQLNVNQLQIENEYYSTIRPKRVAASGERPTSALQRGGVEYLELRALDVSPFDPAGISQSQQKFLEAFLIYCVLLDSPPMDDAELAAITTNHSLIAREGRKPGLTLRRDGQWVDMQEWAAAIVQQMQPVCEILDAGGEGGYMESLEVQRAAVRDPARTPSARLLHELHESGQSFADYGLTLANDYKGYFTGLGDDFNAHRQLLLNESCDSLVRQAEIEASDTLTLDDYLARYYA